MAQREKIIVEGEDRASDAFDKAGGSFEGMTSKIGKFATGAVAGLAVAKMAQLASQTVGLAVDAEEAGSAFATTFGEATVAATEFVDDFANKAGFARHELQQLLATSGNVAQGIGATETKSAALAESMARLAGDVASFSNAAGGSEAVLMALQSALTGEREALKTYGIAISEAEVAQLALNETGKTRVDQLTRLEKAEATVALAYEKAGKAVGDLDRTQDSAANTMRRLRAETKEAGAEFGAALLPIVEDIMPELIEAIPEVTTAIAALAAGLVGLQDPIVWLLSWIPDVVAGLELIGRQVVTSGREFESAFGDMAKSGKDMNDQWEDTSDQWSDSRNAANDLTVAIHALRTGAVPGADAAARMANVLRDLGGQGSITAEAIDEVASAAGATAARQFDAIRDLRRYAIEHGWTADQVQLLKEASGELAVAAGQATDETREGERWMARYGISVDDATGAVEEMTPEAAKMAAELEEARKAAQEAARAFREDLLEGADEFVTGFKGAVEELDLTLDEFEANFAERHQQQAELWTNLALLYAHGMDALADELAEGGVEAAGVVADYVDDMERAASMDELIRQAEGDLARLGDVYASGIEDPGLLTRLEAFGFDMNRALQRGLSREALSIEAMRVFGESERSGGQANTTPSIVAPGGQFAFADGGIVPGPQGAAVVATVHGGEEVLSIRDRQLMGSRLDRIASLLESGSGAAGIAELRIIVEEGRIASLESQASNLRATVERLVRQ